MASAAPDRTMKQETAHEHGTLRDSELILFRTRVCERHRQGNCYVADKCPNSHCQTWQRRNPQEYTYSPKLCPEIEFVKRGAKMTLVRRCGRGRACMFAHSKEEELYHPSMYKTKMCNSHPWCKRYFCPFAHSPDELRKGGTTGNIVETHRPLADRSTSGVKSDDRPLRSNTFSGPCHRRETTEGTDLQEMHSGQQSAELSYCSHASRKPLVCPGSPTSSSTCASNGSASPVLTPVLRPCGTASHPHGMSAAPCSDAASAKGSDAAYFRWQNDCTMGPEKNSASWTDGHRYGEEVSNYRKQHSGQSCILDRGFSQSSLDSRTFTTNQLHQERNTDHLADNLTALADSLGLNLHAAEGEQLLHPYLNDAQTRSLIRALIASLPSDLKDAEATTIATATRLPASPDDGAGATGSQHQCERFQSYPDPLSKDLSVAQPFRSPVEVNEERLALDSNLYAASMPTDRQRASHWLNDAMSQAGLPRFSDGFRQSMGTSGVQQQQQQLELDAFSDHMSVPILQSEEAEDDRKVASAAVDRCTRMTPTPSTGSRQPANAPVTHEDKGGGRLDSHVISQTLRSLAPVSETQFYNDEPSAPTSPAPRPASSDKNIPTSEAAGFKGFAGSSTGDGGPSSLVSHYTNNLNLFSDEDFLAYFNHANNTVWDAATTVGQEQDGNSVFAPSCEANGLRKNTCATTRGHDAAPPGGIVRVLDSSDSSLYDAAVAANRSNSNVNSPHTGSCDSLFNHHTLSFFDSADRGSTQQEKSLVSPFASERGGLHYVPPRPQERRRYFMPSSAPHSSHSTQEKVTTATTAMDEQRRQQSGVAVASCRKDYQGGGATASIISERSQVRGLHSLREEQPPQQQHAAVDSCTSSSASSSASSSSPPLFSTSFVPAAGTPPPCSFAPFSAAAAGPSEDCFQNLYRGDNSRYQREDRPPLHPMYPWSADQVASSAMSAVAAATKLQPDDATLMLLKSYCLL